MYVRFCTMFCVGESEILVRLLRKSQQVSRLDSILFGLSREARFMCSNSFIDFSCEVKSKCQLLQYCELWSTVVVLFLTCYILFCIFYVKCFCVGSSKAKALYLLYLVDRQQAREKWSHGSIQLRSFHVRFSAMLIIKSQC